MSYSLSPHHTRELRGAHHWAARHAPVGRPLARILVSEDDPAISALYGAVLTDHGFACLWAPRGDGWATLELARRARPELLITDVNKPGLDGHALRAALRSSPETAQIAVLMVSAMDRRGAQLGPLDDYLLKPFLTEALIYRVAALLPLDRAAHSRLAERARHTPCYEHAHPVTGLPCLHALEQGLGAATAAPGWAALEVGLAGYGALARALGRDRAEALLARLGRVTARAAGAEALVGHTGFDARIAIVGPAARVAAAEAALASILAPLGRRAQLRRADDCAGLALTLPALRAALR